MWFPKGQLQVSALIDARKPQVEGRPGEQPDSGSEEVAGEGPTRMAGRPSRKKGRRSTLTMRKGRGRRTVAQCGL
jgi:hypothetical protein